MSRDGEVGRDNSGANNTLTPRPPLLSSLSPGRGGAATPGLAAGSLGKSIAMIDLLIAAADLVVAAPVVTRNLDHFQRIPGLEVRTY